MASSYKVVRVKLDLAFDHKELSASGTEVPEVTIQYLPAGAAGIVFLIIGETGDPIPLWMMGQKWVSTPPERTGIFISNPTPLPGLFVDLVVGYTVQSAA